jgi:hypothetical protein
VSGDLAKRLRKPAHGRVEVADQPVGILLGAQAFLAGHGGVVEDADSFGGLAADLGGVAAAVRAVDVQRLGGGHWMTGFGAM